jgi:hypothetical protein
MHKNQEEILTGGPIALLLVLLTAIALKSAFISDNSWYAVLLFTVPLLLIFFIMRKKENS